MTNRLLACVLAAAAACVIGCSGSRVPTAKGEATQRVFEIVSPSVVAVVNDDQAQREEEAREAEREAGHQAHMPKKVVDVSLRKEPMPHGTGFVVEDASSKEQVVLTAAHVVRSPERLTLTSKKGQTVEADLMHIDEVRDVAILRPRVPLEGVPPLALATKDPPPGHRVWALGHTGAGLWALAWGVSEGITSGVVDMLGGRLLLFDAPVYPGFSGGPVVTIDADSGKPVVVGVNHAILFVGEKVASISSASSASDIRDTIARKAPAIEARLAAYAKSKENEVRASLFVTKNQAVHKDTTMLTTAALEGNVQTISAEPDSSLGYVAKVPAMAMIAGLPPGDHEITFEVEAPDEKVIESTTRVVTTGPHERVTFATAEFRLGGGKGSPLTSGRFHVHAKLKDQQVGHTDVWIEDPDRNDEAADTVSDAEDLAEPQVDVVVAGMGRPDPFALGNIRGAWVEWRYPRRVEFLWYARGTRGWTGSNVAMSSFVLDAQGKIVGRGVGCLQPDLRPEKAWQCGGNGGDPLIGSVGRYDIVFTINDRPVAVWPMEALVHPYGHGSAIDAWLHQQQKPLQRTSPAQ